MTSMMENIIILYCFYYDVILCDTLLCCYVYRTINDVDDNVSIIIIYYMCTIYYNNIIHSNGAQRSEKSLDTMSSGAERVIGGCRTRKSI